MVVPVVDWVAYAAMLAAIGAMCRWVRAPGVGGPRPPEHPRRAVSARPRRRARGSRRRRAGAPNRAGLRVFWRPPAVPNRRTNPETRSPLPLPPLSPPTPCTCPMRGTPELVAAYDAAVRCYRGVVQNELHESGAVPRVRAILERVAADFDHEAVALLIRYDMPLSLNFVQCFTLAPPPADARGDGVRRMMRAVLSCVAPSPSRSRRA